MRADGAEMGRMQSIIGLKYNPQSWVAREIGDRRNEGIWLGNLGIAYSDLGQVEKAIKYCEDALMIGEEIRDPKIIRFCEKSLESLKNLEN